MLDTDTGICIFGYLSVLDIQLLSFFRKDLQRAKLRRLTIPTRKAASADNVPHFSGVPIFMFVEFYRKRPRVRRQPRQRTK